MEDTVNQRELLAAYVCLKDTPADEISTYSELKHALHYAGYNPSTEFLEKVWQERKNENISFNDFCVIANQLKALDEEDIRKIISDVFIINGNCISVNDLKSLPQMLKRETFVSEYDIDFLVQEVDGKNGVIDINNLCKLFSSTVKEVKDLTLKNLDEKLSEQRLNRRTFTKKETPIKLQGFLGKQSIDVQGWNCASLKGSLFIDDEVIIVHHYSLEVACMGPTFIKISPLKFKSSVLNVDIMAFIFREAADGNKSYVGYTSLKNEDGYNYWIDTLKEGRYVIIPYTTGCIKKKVRDENNPLQLLKNDGKIQLTPDCVRLLEDVFTQMDLDGNNLLNRQEFNLYNWRTSGEIVQDDEWEVVQNNFDVEDGQITLKGFLSLHQLEAEDNGGDVEDLWLSLETIGYNRFGHQEKCCTFALSVYSPVCSPSLLVSGLKSGGLLLDKAVIRSVMEETEPIPVGDRSDLIKFQLVREERACIVLQNKSNNNIRVRVDCSQSENCFSNRESLIWEGEVEKKSAILAHHLAPVSFQKQWSVKCLEVILD